MSKRFKIMLIGTGIGLLLFTVVILAYNKAKTCTQININFEGGSKNSFIQESDILNLVKEQYPDIKNTDIRDINTRELELHIDSFPQVKKADVYTKFNGELNINISQRKPLLRVFNKYNESYYVDTEGFLLPVSEKRAARCIIANGNIPERCKGQRLNVLEDSLNVLDDLYKIASIIAKDNFLNAQIGQIYVTKESEIELIPTVGYHVVNLGSINNYKKKIRNLKYFYTKVLIKENWNKYNRINLKYKNQIVCTNNPY